MSPDSQEAGAEAKHAGSGGGPRPGLLRPKTGHGGAPGGRAHCGEYSNVNPHSLFPSPAKFSFDILGINAQN